MPIFREKKFDRRTEDIERTTYKHGFRHAIVSVSKHKYIGDWRDDRKTGKGIMTSRKQRYEGDFFGNTFQGFGVLARRLRCKVYTLTYRGDWKNGKMDGVGFRRYRDGTVYYGGFKEGLRSGFGQCYYPDGSYYIGNYVLDKREGYGMFVYANGNRYEGYWMADLKHGNGKYYFVTTGQLFDGVWYDDIFTFGNVTDFERERATGPTSYPIRPLELADLETFYTDRQAKALISKIKSCLNISDYELDGEEEEEEEEDEESDDEYEEKE